MASTTDVSRLLLKIMPLDNGHHDDANLPPGWTEAKLARLLEEFFAAEFKSPRETIAIPSLVATSPMRTSRRSLSRWMLPVCLVALLSCGWMMSQLPVAVSPMASRPTAPAIVEIEATDIPFRIERVSFAGTSGVFAQRNEWRQTKTESLEPKSGTWVERTAVELAIEVEPVEQFNESYREQDL